MPKQYQQGLVGATMVFVFVGGFAIANTVLENMQPGDSNNLLLSAGVGAGVAAVLGGLSYMTGVIKV